MDEMGKIMIFMILTIIFTYWVIDRMIIRRWAVTSALILSAIYTILLLVWYG